MPASISEIHSREEIKRAAAQIDRKSTRGPGQMEAESRPLLQALVDAGSELWLDTGDQAAAAAVWSPEMRGLTTNNTLVNQVIQTGALDSTIEAIGRGLKSAYPDMPQKDLIIESAFILNAKLGLSLVERFGAKVSVELHPDLADDWEATLAFGKRYYHIYPSNFIIKVPMTPDGFIAVRKLAEAGVPVNYTLGFSVRQNYFAAVFSRPQYVNVFLGRLGNLVAENNLGSSDNIGEHVTLASQEAVRGLRESRGDTPTRQIAASMRAGEQVATLAGVDVHTIPPKVAQQYLDSGVDPSSIRQRSSAEVPVSLSCDADDAKKVATLWEVSREFTAFADVADASAADIRSGRDLLRMARECGVSDFFRDWPVEEQLEIRKGGKIPDFHRWKSVAAPDDLMSQAALQSFAVDQGELDDRIARLIL